MPQPDRFATRVFGLAVVALIGFLLYRILRPFLEPIYWAFLLAFMLFPWNLRLRKRLGGRAGLAASLMTLGVTLGVAIPAAVGMVAFARQAIELGQRLSALAQRYQIEGFEDLLRLPVIGTAMEWLQKHFGFDAGQVQAWLVQAAQTAVQFLLTHSRDVLFGALGIFGNVVLILFVVFFFFRGGDAIAARAKALIPLDRRRKERLVRHLGDVTRAVVFGNVVTAVVQGAMLGVGFWITGVPSPLVFGVLAAVASFIPLVGTGLIWVPAVIYLFAQGVAWKTTFLVVWSVLIVGSADNVLRPLIVSGKAQMGTLTVFFGALGGLAAFGFVGLFLGPVILALGLTLIQFAEEGEQAAASPAPPAAC